MSSLDDSYCVDSNDYYVLSLFLFNVNTYEKIEFSNYFETVIEIATMNGNILLCGIDR